MGKTMTKLLDRYLRGGLRAPADDNGAGDPPAPAADSASILYGDDDGGEAPKPDAADPAGDVAAADWKEFEPDASKTDEENAAAKAEHDKTKPAEKTDAEKLAETVPEDGKYSLTMPEGVEIDQEMLDALGPDFKDAKLTNGQAQKLADKFIATQTARQTAQAEAWAKTVGEDWPKQAKDDPEIGGAKWDATASNAVRAVKTLGTPALKEYLDASGGGNHPELIRFMSKVGAMIKEDDPAIGNAAGKVAVDRVDVLYPDDKPKGN